MRDDLRRPGVYTSLPAELPPSLDGVDAVVAGETAGAADAALRLASYCRSVTFVTSRSARAGTLRGCANVTILHGCEVVCVDGVDGVESVVVRKIRTGTVFAYNAAAIFLIG